MKMDLKMYVFGESEDVVTWVVAKNQKQAIDIFENITGDRISHYFENLNDYVREASPKETMTYYPDGLTPEKDTMENLIKKHCKEPDVFATSEF